jgi:hypothetical protein
MCVLTPDIVLLRWLIITKIMHAYVLPLQRLSGLCSGAAGGVSTRPLLYRFSFSSTGAKQGDPFVQGTVRTIA